MQIANVVSSNVVRIGHDGQNLYCLFHHGGAYKYPDVPESKFKDFASAESAGKFFHAEIKPHYTAEKLGPTSDALALLTAQPLEKAAA